MAENPPQDPQEDSNNDMSSVQTHSIGPAQLAAQSAASSLQIKELTTEVSSLSTRLLQAMEAQSELEEELGRERRDKDRALVEGGELKKEVQNLREEMQELSAELFDEANTMVSDARRQAAQDVAETTKRNDTLKVQLEERDNLLESLQAQLGALKSAMQARDEQEDQQEQDEDESFESAEEEASDTPAVRPRLSRAPSSRKRLQQTFADLNGPVRPHLRQDLASYRDFMTIIRQAAKLREESQHGAAGAGGVGSAFSGPTSSSTTASTTELPALAKEEHPHTPPTVSAPFKGAHDESSPLTQIYSSYMSPQVHKEMMLKDTRFYKKFISEDFEPTLRLDLAPGLSWLARRSVQSSILDGTIVIDPIAAVNEMYGVNFMTDMWVNGGFSEAAGAVRDANGDPLGDSGPPTPQEEEFKQRPVSALVSFARDAQKLRKEQKDKADADAEAVRRSQEGEAARKSQELARKSSLEGSETRHSQDSPRSSGSMAPPMATISACALCGESRNHSLVYARLHYLRTANTTDDSVENGKGYPLCGYCLVRVRSVCDYLTFLRSVKDGVWKVDGVQAEMKVWDECIRLKERMFWARVGGGFL